MLVYDHATETFRLGGSLLTPRPDGGTVSTALSDGRVLVTGGQIGFHRVTAAAEIFDPATETFSAAGEMTVARTGGISALLSDGRVFIAGGSWWPDEAEPPVLLLAAEIFDPATGQFTAIGSLPEPPSAFAPVPLQDGRLLLIGPSSYFFEPATNAFTPARLMAGEFGSVLRLADGRILIAGHLDGDERPLPARIFDPLSETEVTVGAMVRGRILFSMTLLADGRVLVAGGTTLRTGQVLPAELFDPATGRFMEIAATPRANRVPPTTVLLPDGKVLLVGGTTGTPGAELFLPGVAAAAPGCPTPDAFRPTKGSILDVGLETPRLANLSHRRVLLVYPSHGQVFDARTETFTSAGDLVTPRTFYETTALADGRVLVTGGMVASRISTARAEVYDPGSNRFSAVADMTVERTGHQATRLADGRVLITGGHPSQVEPFPPVPSLQTAEVFDPATNTFAAVGDMSIRRAGHRAVLLADGTVLVAGGELFNSDGSVTTQPADIFDPATGTFSTTVNVSTKQHGQFVVLRDGRVLDTGGYLVGIERSKEARIYDPVARTVDVISPMVHARAEHAATLLSDGRVLLTGGSPGALAAEIFDPATGRFAETAPMRTGRALHAATLLDDGRVLIVGNGGQQPPTELFIPATSP